MLQLPSDPTLLEPSLREQGITHIAGVDEVGRGCLAGPVVAACCILPANALLAGLADSKKLTPNARELLFSRIQNCATAFSIAAVSPEEIDRLNILRASLLAMKMAVESLAVPPNILLIDGRDRVDVALPQRAIIRGDALCPSISAASILAKVARDHLMVCSEKTYPHFSFSFHKGYGTPQHQREIEAHGLTPIHRRAFCCGKTLPLFRRCEKGVKS